MPRGLGIRNISAYWESKTERNPSSEAGERTQLVKSTPCKHGNLSLSRRTHLKFEHRSTHMKSQFGGRVRDRKTSRALWQVSMT